MTDQPDAGRLKSPPFPAISLQKAIERANQLYERERDHLVPMSSAARAWTMSTTSSGPATTVGALKQYGLITDEGSGPGRKVRLTHDALRITQDKVLNSPERAQALKRSFLAPKIFSELWDKYGSNLPSDQTVLNHLTLERKLSGVAPFSDAGAIELLGNYRLGMAFAAPKEVQNEPLTPQASEEEESLMSVEVDSEIKKPTIHNRPVVFTTANLDFPSQERVVFTEEGEPGQNIKLIVSGPLDEYMIDALENYLERQKRRLNRPE